MKIQIALFLYLISIPLLAQDYKQRAEQNLPYLIRDNVLHSQIQINEQGVTMFASAEDSLNNKPEATIYWNEASDFLNMLDDNTVEEAVKRYLQGGTQPRAYSTSRERTPRLVPKSLKGMKIAIDPGHNANRMQNAVIERKFMRIKGEDVGLDHDVQFFESDLTYETAAILRKRLKRAGATVLLTRKKGKSAAGPTFDKWLKTVIKKQLKRDQKSGKFTDEQVQWYKEKATVNEKFRYYFNRHDLRTRADKINAFKPDITLIIHYNASGANMVDGYYKPTEKNYSMAFVGGGFMKNELKKPIDRMHFLRLLLSDDFEHSVNLSKVFMEQHVEVLKVPAIVPQNSVFYLTKNSVYTGKLGVYARNLFLTRHIKGPIVFGESFLQDSKEEALRLYLEDYKEKGITTSSRIGEAVDAYFETVLKYVEEFGDR